MELCLTLPAHSSSLLPYLPRLMKPLVLCLRRSDDLVILGLRTLSIFTAISDANVEVYWPKHEDIDKIFKVGCTLVLGQTEYPPIFDISSPVAPGNGTLKIVNLKVHGELVEGNVIKGHAKVA